MLCNPNCSPTSYDEPKNGELWNVRWKGHCSLSRPPSNHAADLATKEPGAADAASGFAAQDIMPVTLEVKRPYAASSKALGFYSCGRYDSGTVSAEHLSRAIATEVGKMSWNSSCEIFRGGCRNSGAVSSTRRCESHRYRYILAICVEPCCSHPPQKPQALQSEKSRAWYDHQHQRPNNEVSQPPLGHAAHVARTLERSAASSPLQRWLSGRGETDRNREAVRTPC